MQDPASAVRRRAILLVLGEALAFSLVAAMIKLLGGAIPLAEVMLFRNLFALPALMPQAMAHGGWRALRTRAPLGHLQRSGWGLLAMGGSFLTDSRRQRIGCRDSGGSNRKTPPGKADDA